MQLSEEQIELRRLRARIINRFHKACADYSLIEDNDHILIGLSGGKDSLALVELLGARQKIYVPRFKVSAVHIRMQNISYQSDSMYLQQFCNAAGVDYYEQSTSFEENSAGHQHQQKSHCFLCSWYRRKAMFKIAEELGCNKIALGHHKDDIVETLLMNLIFQGRFDTILPRMQMDKFPMTLIRPLCLITESDLKRYAELQHYIKQPKLCPFERESHRADIKSLISQLEQYNPNVRDSIWGAIVSGKEIS